MSKEPAYHQDAFYNSNNQFYSSKRIDLNPRYGKDDGKKFSENSDRLTDCQGFTRKTNPLDKNSKISKCNICSSIYHWAKQCPHSYKNKSKSKGESQIALLGELWIH